MARYPNPFPVPPPLPPKPARRQREYVRLRKEEIVSAIEQKCGSVQIVERHGEGKHKVFILPEAFNELKSIVSYGRRSPMNCLEQMYNGLGHYFKGEQEENYIVISHFIHFHTTNRTQSSASILEPNGKESLGTRIMCYYCDEYRRYERQFNKDEYGFTVDPFLQYGSSETVLDGHTHPDIGAYLSDRDMDTGRARAQTDPMCMFVCDPIQKLMYAGTGKNLEEAEVIVYGRVATQEAGFEKTVKQETMVSGEDAPIGTIARMAQECIAVPSYCGFIRLQRSLRGGMRLIVKLEESRSKCRAKEPKRNRDSIWLRVKQKVQSLIRQDAN